MLYALSIAGADGSGNYVLDEPALRLWLARVAEDIAPIRDDERAVSYESLATAAMAGAPQGPYAAGEFPKFTAVRERNGSLVHVLVKFSSSDGSVRSLRWSDLLVCEALAFETICEAGAETRINKFENRASKPPARCIQV